MKQAMTCHAGAKPPRARRDQHVRPGHKVWDPAILRTSPNP